MIPLSTAGSCARKVGRVHVVSVWPAVAGEGGGGWGVGGVERGGSRLCFSGVETNSQISSQTEEQREKGGEWFVSGEQREFGCKTRIDLALSPNPTPSLVLLTGQYNTNYQERFFVLEAGKEEEEEGERERERERVSA